MDNVHKSKILLLLVIKEINNSKKMAYKWQCWDRQKFLKDSKHSDLWAPPKWTTVKIWLYERKSLHFSFFPFARNKRIAGKNGEEGIFISSLILVNDIHLGV